MSQISELKKRMKNATHADFMVLAKQVVDRIWQVSVGTPHELAAKRLKTAMAMNEFQGYEDMGNMSDWRLAQEFRRMAQELADDKNYIIWPESLTDAAAMIERLGREVGCKDSIKSKFERDIAGKRAQLELHRLLVEYDIDLDVDSDQLLRDLPQMKLGRTVNTEIRQALKAVGDDRVATYDATREPDQVLVRLTESWGGPADGYNLVVEDGQIEKITYWYQEWGDGAELKVTGEDFDDLKEFFEAALYLDE